MQHKRSKRCRGSLGDRSVVFTLQSEFQENIRERQSDLPDRFGEVKEEKSSASSISLNYDFLFL